MFEVSRIENARRQQHDGWFDVAGRSQRTQGGEQELAVMLDGLDGALAEELGEKDASSPRG